jgi:hypothetical protein
VPFRRGASFDDALNTEISVKAQEDGQTLKKFIGSFPAVITTLCITRFFLGGEPRLPTAVSPFWPDLSVLLPSCPCLQFHWIHPRHSEGWKHWKSEM